jgi:putative DNA primase/helicase
MNELVERGGLNKESVEEKKPTRTNQQAEVNIEPLLNQNTEAALALRRRFLEAGDTFYYRGARGESDKVAFTDQGKRLTTDHDDPSVIHGMVLRAQEKGWTALRVKGSDEFKAEAWLQASLAGIEVEGYKPREIDRARLEERKGQSQQDRIEPENRLERVAPRDRVTSRAEESSDSLTAGQKLAVTTLETILRERGDSAKMIAAAVEEAKARLQGERLYVGKIVEHGIDHYEHDKKNDRSYFVKVATPKGEREVWGVDLARAFEQSDVKTGEIVALVQKAHERVTVNVLVRDESGAEVGKAAQPAKRNVWDVINLHTLGLGEREKVVEAARVMTQEPVVNVFDRTAARTDQAPEMTRTREQERTREGR